MRTREGFERLSIFIAELRFPFGSEPQVEGHAKVHFRSSLARYRSDAFDSLALCMPELREKIRNVPSYLAKFLDCVHAARTPAKLVASLSMHMHPSCSLAKDAWGPVHRKIVYRSDPYTLYQMRTPSISLVDDGTSGDDSHAFGLPADVYERIVRWGGHEVPLDQVACLIDIVLAPMYTRARS